MKSKWVCGSVARWFVRLSVCAVCALGAAAPASAQFENKTCLVLDSQFSKVVRNYALALGFKEIKDDVTEASFIADLQAKQWDLIAIELVWMKITNKTLLVDLFEQQHAGGARFLICYAHLDEWPEVWEFLGIANAVDPVNLNHVKPPKPGNAIWFSSSSGSTILNSKWSDHGDRLTPDEGSIVVSQFSTGVAASVLTADQSRIVNGWNTDEYPDLGVIKDMIYYLVGCPADLNRDGKLDNIDFSLMQVAFSSKNGAVNFDFDDAFTVFDFFDFINHFVDGCPQ